MAEFVRYERTDNVAVITLDNPPVNAFSPGVAEQLFSRLDQATEDAEVQAIVLIGGGRTFTAGADIKEFGKLIAGEKTETTPSDSLARVIYRLEDCSKPVVAAIHGSALGGGLEVAMGCHYRVAVESAKVGVPEVKLGLIPGAMGTQRLPRLCGIARAAEMCATGVMVGAQQALECGILDKIVDDPLQSEAIRFAQAIVVSGKPPRKTRDIADRLGEPQQNQVAIAKLKQQIAKKTRGQIAPAKAIEAVEAAATLPFLDAVKKEAELFQQCLHSEQSKGLIHIFFGERVVAKIHGIGKETSRRTIEKAAVVGAGTMGGGITMAYVNAGIPVVLKEINQEQLDRGMDRIRQTYAASVKRGRMTAEEAELRVALIAPTVDYQELSDADIIVEAVFEGMELKKHVFGEIDQVAKPNAVLATNTSTLDIDQIAVATQRPESVIGHHFFSPANVMRLLEIVRGEASSDEVIATSMDLAKRLGKVGVLVGNCFGFVGNRMFGPYQREAQFLLEEGARVEQVDKALFDFGWAMGPLAVSDLAGIDVSWRIHQEIKDSIPPGMRESLVADKLYEMDRYGQKTAAGWYRYDGREAIPDPVVQQLIEKTAVEAGIARGAITDDQIVERTMYALANEGARILEEGIALRAVDIDVIYVYGYGFPAWRGGPMMYADSVGLERVYERVCHFQETEGFWWEPAPLLKELAQNGGSFRDFKA
jgi:3-hydroxyacyl-CoA dehydrogenase